MNKNFKKYEMWEPRGNNTQRDETAYTIDGCFYMNSRNPFDRIERPYNPFGPIERPLKHT